MPLLILQFFSPFLVGPRIFLAYNITSLHFAVYLLSRSGKIFLFPLPPYFYSSGKNKNKNKRQSQEGVLSIIKEFLGGNIGYSKSQDTYYYGSTNFGEARKVIQYFDQYHLQSRKHINYLR